VAGVRKGRGRELGHETSLLPRTPLAFLSRLKLPFPSLSNACHAGYLVIDMIISRCDCIFGELLGTFSNYESNDSNENTTNHHPFPFITPFCTFHTFFSVQVQHKNC